MNKKINIGLLGFGVVGSGVVKIFQKNKNIIEQRTGVEICLKRIADIDLKKKRDVKVDKNILTTDPMNVINDPQIKIIIEAMGGTHPARELILKAINNGKHIVTSNKEVIAKHGREIFKAAKNKGVDVFIEATVGGGIPVIRSLKVGLSANKIEEVCGIVNGTTNYILSSMSKEQKTFNEVLKKAQKLGYAESNPKNDIGGYDPACKLTILASIAFGAKVNFKDIYYEGIENIDIRDIEYAHGFGYEIKLLVIAKEEKDGLVLKVHPTLVSCDHPLASINGVYNSIFIKGNFIQNIMLYGRGAGAGPTASAVVDDVMDIIYGIEHTLTRRNLIYEFKKRKIIDIKNTESEFYMSLWVTDKPGVLEKITGIFGKYKVSIMNILQMDIEKGNAELVIVTHKVKEENMHNAVALIKKLNVVKRVDSLIRVGID